ncbi:unnamed protein product [Mytilus coruscus]|uniref:Uncharacterized protein n=1 Tax=Mytilus coruscus TaxID=42192 RepID=A0A6J8C6E7_MYTCO|nr:unnamed protein product [Mytilus coruscus]
MPGEKSNLRNENSRHSDTYDLLIIGSSIIKDLDGKRMYKHRKVKITTLHDKTVFGAIQYIKSFRDKAKHIMFQIGSNDIEQKTPDEVIQEIEELVRVTLNDITQMQKSLLRKYCHAFLSGRYYAKFFNEHRLFLMFNYHVQKTLYMKCSINIDKEIGLEEKGWHWIKSYKWTENSKLKLIDALLTENVKNEIIEFEMVNYEENQVGVDEATEN